MDTKQKVEYLRSTLQRSSDAIQQAVRLQQNVLDHLNTLMPSDPVIVLSSNGEYKVDPRSGEVLQLQQTAKQSNDSPDVRVVQFNLSEFAHFIGRPVEPGETIDILLLGYWYHRLGTRCSPYEVPEYQTPEEEARQDYLNEMDKPYTVILLYADYVTDDNFGQDTYMTSVVASSPGGAIHKARHQLISEIPGGVEDEEDLFCIACIEGEHQDLK